MPREPRILIVDDQRAMAETVADGLADHGFDAQVLDSGKQALAAISSKERFAAVVTDLRMPDVDGLELLAASMAQDPKRPVVVMTAYGAIDTAIEAMRRGAFHYLTKPFKVEELAIVLRRALEQADLRREAEQLRSQLAAAKKPPRVVAESEAMRRVLETLDRVADADAPVLILGETGTGKGLLAETLHQKSARRDGPFVSVNCAAIPEQLLESELFGHVRGAFTGATADRAGLFAEADRGTLFLDEIGDMPPALQAKLLHVLERGVVRPVGGAKERAVDVRIVTATHRDLRERAESGAFREDLLYRLDVVSIEVPPLRARREDFPALLETFFRAAKSRHATTPAERFSPEALRVMAEHRWPGNVRELAHVVERCVLLARGPVIDIDDLPPSVRAPARPSPAFSGEVVPLREVQRRYAQWAFDQLGHHRGKTSEKLEIDPKTLAKLLAPE